MADGEAAPARVSRQEAKAKGLVRYFPGSTCKRGHTVERYTRNGNCVVCELENTVRKQKSDPEWALACRKRTYQNCADARRAYTRNYRLSFPGGPKEYDRLHAAPKNKKAAWWKNWADRHREHLRVKDKNRDPEKKLLGRRRLAAKNKERIRENEKRRDPEKNRLRRQRHQIRHRGWKKGAEGSFTKADIQTLMDAQNGLCNGCARDISRKFDIDHMQPISRGGSNWPSNLQLLCRSCNAEKNDKTVDEWIAYRSVRVAA